MEKYKRLIEILKGYGSAVVAFSGGVDSTFLLYAAKEALGDKVYAFTIKTPYIPDWELNEAIDLAIQIGVQHSVLTVKIPEEIENNPPDRCYLCKRKLFQQIKAKAADLQIDYVLDGTNADDKNDYRPGLRALKELDIKSPLREADLGKEEIRRLSKEFGLSTAQKPAYACLLTRIPYNTPIVYDELQRIEKAELSLFALGFEGARVRSHGNIARIELHGDQFEVLNRETRSKIITELKQIGYEYVCVDLGGYVMGSMNQNIQKDI